MRRHQQKLIIEMLGALNEATSEMKYFFSCDRGQEVVRLVSDCTSYVLQLMNFIKQIEDNDTVTVSLLEECYTLLCQADLKSDDFINLLQQQLIKIENSVKTELKPNKIEIAFMSYKASMFDALESIWLAAKDDPQCDAFVVPIPYYNRNIDGSLGQMYYEGDCYPDYVPVDDWQSYKVEERQPDIIFIHNPYDDENRVTSVHPDFYSKRLKNFTGMLVYVPYYVCLNGVSKDFCICAGNRYAHRVIVQSEEVREMSISSFSEFETEYNCKGLFGDTEKKFVALGSPKFDKVINTKPEDYKIPAEWQKLIDKPNGKKKQVVLYNTSIGGILNGNEQALRKLRSVLGYFKKCDDIVLLWRPHPLNETTYKAMRPLLFNTYMNIVSEYKRECFGIYDDTADFHQAISISDAYYGDMSSLVVLYLCTAKPVMIQTEMIFENKELHRIPESHTLCNANSSFSKAEQGIFYENESYTLYDFLKNMGGNDHLMIGMRQSELQKRQISNGDGTAGNAIYAYCKNEVFK